MKLFQRILFVLILVTSTGVTAFAQCGHIIATDYNECLEGVKDSSGRWIIPPRYENINWLDCNSYEVFQGSKAGVADTNGKLVVPIIYENIGSTWCRGFYRMYSGKRNGIINAQNDTIVPPIYKQIVTSQDSVFFAYAGWGKWIIYLHDGTKMRNPHRSRFHPERMGERLFRVTHRRWFLEDRYGLINDSGGVILPCNYSAILSSGHELLGIERKGKHGYISKQGKTVWPMVLDSREDVYDPFEHSYDFTFTSDTVGIASSNGKFGLITTTGNLVLPFEYDRISPVNNYYWGTNFGWAAYKDGKAGIYTRERGWITERDFDYIDPVTNYFTETDSQKVTLFVAIKNNFYGAQTTTGQILVPYVYTDMIVNEGVHMFRSGDSIITLETTQNSNRRDLMRLALKLPSDTLELDFTTSPTIYQMNSTQLFSTYTGENGTMVYYNSSHTHDTLFHESGTYILNSGETYGMDFPDSILMASMVITRKLQPSLRLEDGSVYYEVDSVDETNETYSLWSGGNFVLSKGEFDPDYIREEHNDSTHHYYVTGTSKVFRDDGKIIFPANRWDYVRIEEESGSNPTHFIVTDKSDHTGIADTNGRIIFAPQKRVIGEHNQNYAWLYKRSSWPDLRKRSKRWRVVDISTGRKAAPSKIAYHSRTKFWGHYLCGGDKKTGAFLYDLQQQRKIASQYNSVDPLNDSATVSMVRTCYGNIGVIDHAGQLLVDTVWRFFTPLEETVEYSKFNDWYYFTTTAHYYKFILLYNDTGSVLLDIAARRIVSHDTISNLFYRNMEIWSDTSFTAAYDNYRGESNSGKVVLHLSRTDSTHLRKWHLEQLSDSIYTRRRSVTDENYTSLMRAYPCDYCENKFETPPIYPSPNFLYSGYNYGLSYAGDSVLSFSGISQYSLFWRTNIFLFPDGPRAFNLDSLFNPQQDWRNFVINEVMTAINSRLFVEGDCHNPAGFPHMLKNRFLITSEGIALYPQRFQENDEPMVIVIPWEHANPYLRADVRTKLPVSGPD